jgi:hypothetical protein
LPLPDDTDRTIQSKHYRSHVGPPERYDLIGAMQFNLLTFLGLRETHYLLDIGCGSLRGGRLFIPYLLPGRYYGIEPDQWLIDDGVKNELGQDMVRIKQPVFSNDANFTLTSFGRSFDFLLAQSIFTHAAQSHIRRCLSEAAQVMTPSSIFAATIFRGQTDYEGAEWREADALTYRLETMQGLARQQGLICLPIGWPHPSGQFWLAFTKPENESTVAALCRQATRMWQPERKGWRAIFGGR